MSMSAKHLRPTLFVAARDVNFIPVLSIPYFYADVQIKIPDV